MSVTVEVLMAILAVISGVSGVFVAFLNQKVGRIADRIEDNRQFLTQVNARVDKLETQVREHHEAHEMHVSERVAKLEREVVLARVEALTATNAEAHAAISTQIEELRRAIDQLKAQIAKMNGHPKEAK